MNAAQDERILKLEAQVAELTKQVAKLAAKFKKLDGQLHPLSPRVRVVGSMKDFVSKSLNPDS